MKYLGITSSSNRILFLIWNDVPFLFHAIISLYWSSLFSKIIYNFCGKLNNDECNDDDDDCEDDDDECNNDDDECDDDCEDGDCCNCDSDMEDKYMIVITPNTIELSTADDVVQVYMYSK